ncbi:MAG: VOC family protein [Paenibacillus macerans]|uniref:3-demethylubiquinone-9 3-methyltransferase family protein n=1 Tax=Paenibacillus macerans TaxID=44252 RepID=A0A090ZMZ0_PAEMA|nr:VOC family protein [Paenibacillus macerans]KFN11595.1 3-demethylubiquinone-9 3-methyltransferase family protein [Paenibacillus macerans]MBS5911487.1 VOC family protein [Paenibacillus macerans]MCY7559187.1 VOC family protein [Paenibacillus macerans]MDU7474543.1 VOC family protein [Paenibacillus macerans]MEC0137925.1 VOC family protein [Paenibacillus macerans]
MILLTTPLIALNGQAEEAIAFYEQALQAKVAFKQTFGEMPEPQQPMTDEVKKRIAHSILKLGETELYVCDIFPGEPHQPGSQVTVCLTSSTADYTQQLYEALKEGGRVDLPLQSIYFSPAYAVVTDKFGVTFHLFTNRPA